MMKKRICALLLCFVMLFSLTGITAYAEFPKINFFGVQNKVDFAWKNMSEINTLPGNAVFTLTFKTINRTTVNYTVEIYDDDKIISTKYITIKPGAEAKKDLSVNR